MRRSFTFPGQGSQAVGMGKDLAEAFPIAREVFEEVDEALGQHLSKLMFEGPMEDLTLTENTQPALMAMSVAVVRTIEKEGNLKLSDLCAFVAGHSLGEYSALAAAGTFSLVDTSKLLKLRGQSMQKAVPVGEGSMAALIGVDMSVAEEVAKEAAQSEVCSVANDNAPGQVVISGSKAAIDRAMILAKEKGAKLAKELPVSAPFHCALMQPAADAMAEALAQVSTTPPTVPLIANVTAKETSDPDEIRKLLVEQVTGRVRWTECVQYMADQNVESVVELGAGKVLSGMAKRIDKSLSQVTIGTPTEIESFLKSL